MNFAPLLAVCGPDNPYVIPSFPEQFIRTPFEHWCEPPSFLLSRCLAVGPLLSVTYMRPGNHTLNVSCISFLKHTFYPLLKYYSPKFPLKCQVLCWASFLPWSGAVSLDSELFYFSPQPFKNIPSKSQFPIPPPIQCETIPPKSYNKNKISKNLMKRLTWH